MLDGLCRAAWVALLMAASLVRAGEPAGSYVVEVDLTHEIHALGSDDPFVSEPAVERLVALGPLTLPALATALRQEPAEVRAGVVDVVRQFDDPAAVALLIEAAGDRDAQVRANAVLALGLGGNAEGRAVVEASLRDPDVTARRSAVAACATLCTSAAAFTRLTQLALGDGTGPMARASLMTAVADANPERAARARTAIAADAVPRLADADPTRRLDAALTAALIGEPRVIPILTDALRAGAAAVAQQAALALGGVPTPEAVAVLADAALGNAAGVSNAACISLQRLQARAVPGTGEALAACAMKGTPAPAAPTTVPRP